MLDSYRCECNENYSKIGEERIDQIILEKCYLVPEAIVDASALYIILIFVVAVAFVPIVVFAFFAIRRRRKLKASEYFGYAMGMGPDEDHYDYMEADIEIPRPRLEYYRNPFPPQFFIDNSKKFDEILA